MEKTKPGVVDRIKHAPLKVVIAGATSPAGKAVVGDFLARGARVAAIGQDPSKLDVLAASHDGVVPYKCNLADLAAVQGVAARVREDFGSVDGLIHLVGGWRGGKGITDQTDEDWDVLHTSIMTTLRNTTRVFYPDLKASRQGRLVIVSATAATKPTAGNAGYSAIKAAAEAWVLGIANGFSAAQSIREPTTSAQRSAAVVFVVKALLDDAMRESDPLRQFKGYTHVKELSVRIADLFEAPASLINGTRQHLT